MTITASIASDSKSGSLTVRSPTTGSLRFVSVVPSDKSITLRGQGGNGRQENAAVTFQVVDVAGQGYCYLKGDQNLPYGFVVQILATLNRMGVEEIGMVTVPPEHL